MLWNKAPIMLMPVGLKRLGKKLKKTPIDDTLISPAPKLKTKAGPRNVPEIIEETIILINVTVRAGLKPYNSSVKSEIILDMPSLNQGRGVGNILSILWRPIA